MKRTDKSAGPTFIRHRIRQYVTQNFKPFSTELHIDSCPATSFYTTSREKRFAQPQALSLPLSNRPGILEGDRLMVCKGSGFTTARLPRGFSLRTPHPNTTSKCDKFHSTPSQILRLQTKAVSPGNTIVDPLPPRTMEKNSKRKVLNNFGKQATTHLCSLMLTSV